MSWSTNLWNPTLINMKKIFTLIGFFSLCVTMMAQGPLRTSAEEYGELQSIFKEDFSKMTTGEVGAPDFNVEDFLLGFPDECEYPWWNLNPKYTNQEHWGGMNVWPAGGTVYLECDENTGGARVSLPNIDGSMNDGYVVLRFRARTESGKVNNCLFVEGAETNNMGPEWRNLESYFGSEVNDTWKDYEFIFSNVGSSTIFIIGSQTGIGPSIAPIYLDDVELFSLKQFVGTPKVLKHTNYVGHGQNASFQANWEAVEGADSYMINVYTMNDYGIPVDYIVEDEVVNGTSYTVDNAVSGVVYYYTVVALKDDLKSLPSTPMIVEDIAVPENLASTPIVEGKYTATWDAVPSAQRYNYIAYFDRKAAADGEFVVTSEDFSNLHFPESPELGDLSGQVSTITIETDQGNHFDTYYLTDFKQSGWYSTMSLPCAGYLKLDGWMYQYGAGDAGLISPELDLSKNGGAFDLNVKSYGVIDEFGNLTTCAAALFTFDEEKGDYTQQELIYFDQGEEAWQNNTAHFTKGTDKSIIGLYAVRGAENLFLDDLKIVQNYKAGESFRDPFFASPRHDGTEVEVVLPAQVVDADVYHRVQAVRSKRSNNQNKAFDEVISKFSDLLYVGKGSSTGICSEVLLSKATVQMRDGQLIVNNVNGETVEVFNIAGEKVFGDRTGNTTVSVAVPQHGTYIVKVGKQTVKVVF